jgi:hypothetical protein
MRGCTACAQQSIARFKESDHALVRLYHTAEKDVARYFKDGTPVDV